MSILNMPNDGLFNVLIVLTRALVHLGAMQRDDLLKACGNDLDVIDSKQLGQTLNRWIEFGLFVSEGGKIGIHGSYRARLGKTADIAETRLPKVLREIAFAPENNARFWSSEENKAADLCRGLSWILAQNVYGIDTSSHAPINKLEGEQVSDTNKQIFRNDTRWNGLRTWMTYLGFARSGAPVTMDPTEAIRDTLPEIFGSEKMLSAPAFIERVGEKLPVLDGGIYRLQIEAVLNRQHWLPPSDGYVSTSLSRAIQRLDREGLIVPETKSDSEGGITLVGANERIWRTITHIRLLPAGKGK